jgi:UDP-3-O-[3-hydroxymyristoyl] glucosamine N-acyltransferase
MFDLTTVQNWIKAHVANESFVAALLPHLKLAKLATLKDAGPNDVAFFFSKHYLDDLLKSKAGVIVTGSAFVGQIEAANIPQWKTSVFLACEQPYAAMATLTGHFSKIQSSHDHQDYNTVTEIHPTAVVGEDVHLGKGVTIGAHSVIEPGSVIGDGVVIYPQCFVGPDCSIGEGTVLFPRVTLYEKTVVGKRCRLHSGVVIGADGFGYSPVVDPATKKPVDHQKIYHLGRVVIEDDVEIGSNSTIDRGTLGDTTIHSKVKIDNLVQVGHNCEVGEGAILCGTAGMAGSSSLGKFVYVGANAGTGNQVHVGDYATLAAYTGAAKDVEPSAEMGGVPARPLSDYYRILAIQNKLLREKSRRK